MKFSEFQTVLSKVQQYTSEAEVILKDVESGAETVLHSIGIELGVNGDPTSSTVTINHGTAPAPAADPPGVPVAEAEQTAAAAG